MLKKDLKEITSTHGEYQAMCICLPDIAGSQTKI